MSVRVCTLTEFQQKVAHVAEFSRQRHQPGWLQKNKKEESIVQQTGQLDGLSCKVEGCLHVKCWTWCFHDLQLKPEVLIELFQSEIVSD